MLHLRHCELKPAVQQRPIYVPCTSFKKVITALLLSEARYIEPAILQRTLCDSLIILSLCVLYFLCSVTHQPFFLSAVISCLFLSFLFVRISIGYKRPRTWWSVSKDQTLPHKLQGWRHICGDRYSPHLHTYDQCNLITFYDMHPITIYWPLAPTHPR